MIDWLRWQKLWGRLIRQARKKAACFGNMHSMK